MPAKRPGEAIINSYMASATPEEREDALANLYAAMEVVFRIVTRNAAIPSGDSTQLEAGGRIPSLPDPP